MGTQDVNLSETVAALVRRAREAQRIADGYGQARVDDLVTAAGWAIIEPARNRELAELAVADTGIGDVADKVRKNQRKTFGLLRDLQGAKSVGVIADDPATGIVEIARPVGVVCAITPSTNPAATPANKIINALKGRNAVIVAPSPKGWSTCARLIEFIHAQFDRIAAPLDLVQLLPAPVDKQGTAELMRQCDLVVATGSQANVRAAYASGTPAFGVGAGNVAVIVDDSVAVARAADCIIASKTFDHATSCSSENSLVLVGGVRDAMLDALRERGGVLLDAAQKARLQALMWPEGKLSAAVIGQSASSIARLAGIDTVAAARPSILLVDEDGVGPAHPFSAEKLSPVLALYAVRDFDDALAIVERIYAYQGAGHSVGLHSARPEHALQLGLRLPVSRVIVDQAHCFATGGSFDNGLPFSLSMGCGTWGRNNFSDNMNYRHYLNITRVSRPIPEVVPSEEHIFGAFFGAARPGMTIRALIEGWEEAAPQALYALSTESPARLSFAELAAGSRRIGTLLRGHGLRPGDTVSLVMPNGLQTLRVLLGTMAQGFIVNPVNLMSQSEQMRYVLGHSDCKLVFVAPEWEAAVRALLSGLDRPVALVVAEPDGLRLPGEDEAECFTAPVPAGAVALLMYTSGTTGVPKGVMLTQANLVANARSISAEHALIAADRVLGVLPLYHINAFAVTMLAPLAHGGSVAVAAKFSAARFWQQAIDAQCTWINVVPTIISFLLEGQAPPPEALARLRFCRSASAALPPEHLRAFERKFGIGIIETMGLTECVAPCFSNPLQPAQRRLGSVGRASGCEARIIDSACTPLAPGRRGEIAIRGANVMRGYYKDDAATAAAFTPDGWLRSGDLGHRDDDGFFFVTGRLKELIIKGGENIAPREIDEVLLAHPAVLDAAAVGLPDAHYGQEILAAVVLRDGMACSEDELRDFCLQRLGRYKTPKVLRFVAELPRGPSGKVQRLKLLDGG